MNLVARNPRICYDSMLKGLTMKTLLAAILSLALVAPLAGSAQTVQVTPQEIQAIALVVPCVTNGAASTVSWTNNSDADLLPLTLMQDIAVADLTNTLEVTYLPRVYGAASNVTYRIGAPAAQVAGAESVQALANYPVLRRGDVLTFSSTTGANTATNAYVKLFVTYARIP